MAEVAEGLGQIDAASPSVSIKKAATKITAVAPAVRPEQVQAVSSPKSVRLCARGLQPFSGSWKSPKDSNSAYTPYSRVWTKCRKK